MNSPTEDVLERLLGSLAAASEEPGNRLLREAVTQAEAEVRELIKSAEKAALLQNVVAALENDRKNGASAAASVAGDRPPEPTTEEGSAPAAQGYYLFGIVAADQPGIHGEAPRMHPAHPVQLLCERTLQVLASLVPLAEFQLAGKGKPVQDLDWISAKAAAHDGVLRQALDGGPVIPFRFGTIARTADDARRLLARHHDALVNLLESFRGKREWGVKIGRRIETPLQAEPAASGQTSSEALSGTAYLRNRQEEQAEQGQARQDEQDFLQRCHERLSELAAGAVILPLRGAANGCDRLVLNGAYLVADTDVDRFHSLVRRLEAEREGSYDFQATGPWPAYNFVNLDLTPRETP